jgi:hypothetical protein
VGALRDDVETSINIPTFYVHLASLAQFVHLFISWGVGDKGRCNAVLVAKQERICVGDDECWGSQV